MCVYVCLIAVYTYLMFIITMFIDLIFGHV